MGRAVAICLTLLMVLGAGWMFLHVRSAPPRHAGQPRDGDLPPVPASERPLLLTNSAECQKCHPGVYAEWEASHHRLAYTNPEVQKLSRGFQDKDCLPCHLPRPVFETGLGVRVLERSTRREEGVDCFTCHRAGNACLGTGDPGAAGETAPCNPLRYEPVGSMLLCSPCHDQHKVHKDWAETRFAVPGSGYRDCNDCHMPIVERTRPDGRKRPGRSHLFKGAHHADMIRSAAKLEASGGGPGVLTLRVLNDGTGHNFPADERHRAVDLEITLEDDHGRSSTVRVDRFRNPYREEFDIKNPLRAPGARASWKRDAPPFGEVLVDATRVAAGHHPERTAHYPESTQIPAGEARSYTVDLPAGVKRATVRLWYRIQPFLENDASVLVAEHVVQF